MGRAEEEESLLQSIIERQSENTITDAEILQEIDGFAPTIEEPLLYQFRISILRRSNRLNEAFEAAEIYMNAIRDIVGESVVFVATALTLAEVYNSRKNYCEACKSYTLASLLVATGSEEQHQYKRLARLALEAEANAKAHAHALELVPDLDEPGPSRRKSKSTKRRVEGGASEPVVPDPEKSGPSHRKSTAPEVQGDASEADESETPQDAAVGQGAQGPPIQSDEPQLLSPENEEVLGNSAPEASSIIPQPWTWSQTFIPDIRDDFMDERIRSGKLKIANSELPVTLIKATESQVSKFAQLLSLRDGDGDSGNPHILRVDSLVQEPSNSLLCESVFTVDSFFQEKMATFKGGIVGFLGDERRSDWFKAIEDDLNIIICDVLEGMLILFRCGYCCGDLDKNIYVTSSTHRGRILPVLASTTTQKKDITQLRKKIVSILEMPFDPKHKLHYKDNQLPNELRCLLSSLQLEVMRHVPVRFLLHQPFKWDHNDRFEFIQNLRFALKRNEIDGSRLNRQLSYLSRYGKDVMGATWQTLITHSDFWKVYQFRSTDYRSPLDIQRFINACYGHINDPPQQDYSDIEIDEKIQEFFPEIYVDLYNCLLRSSRGQTLSGILKKDRVLVLSRRFSSLKQVRTGKKNG